MSTTTHSLPLKTNEELPVTYSDSGAGRPLLLLHGGGGPRTVDDFGTLLAGDSTNGLRVIAPVHPGFDGTPRAESLDGPAKLAVLYAELLQALELDDVLVVGNSLGGWIASELAILAPARVSGYVLVDAVGIQVEGHPAVDFFSLPLSEIADYSFYDPEPFRIDPAALPPAAQQALLANRVTLEVYGGQAMTDPTLRARLGSVRTRTLVVWGEADRVLDAENGRALAAAVPGARFELMPRTGHLPQMETPRELADLILGFARETQAATERA